MKKSIIQPRFAAWDSKVCDVFKRKFAKALGSQELSLIDRVYWEDVYASTINDRMRKLV